MIETLVPLIVFEYPGDQLPTTLADEAWDALIREVSGNTSDIQLLHMLAIWGWQRVCVSTSWIQQTFMQTVMVWIALRQHPSWETWVQHLSTRKPPGDWLFMPELAPWQTDVLHMFLEAATSKWEKFYQEAPDADWPQSSEALMPLLHYHRELWSVEAISYLCYKDGRPLRARGYDGPIAGVCFLTQTNGIGQLQELLALLKDKEDVSVTTHAQLLRLHELMSPYWPGYLCMALGYLQQGLNYCAFISKTVRKPSGGSEVELRALWESLLLLASKEQHDNGKLPSAISFAEEALRLQPA